MNIKGKSRCEETDKGWYIHFKGHHKKQEFKFRIGPYATERSAIRAEKKYFYMGTINTIISTTVEVSRKEIQMLEMALKSWRTTFKDL